MTNEHQKPMVALGELNTVVDDVTRVRRAVNKILDNQTHLNDKQIGIVSGELHSIIDRLNLTIRYINGTAHQ